MIASEKIYFNVGGVYQIYVLLVLSVL